MRALKVAFVVQGEGRGHMTQALALAGFLRDAGHELTAVMVGRSPHRSVPPYFVERIGAPVEPFEAPAQVPGRDGRALSVPATAADALRRLPAFVRAGFRIQEVVRGADVVVNFLDVVAGLSNVVLRGRVPTVAVAHNHVFLHPAVHRAMSAAPGAGLGGRWSLAERLVFGWARASALGSSARVALSFAPMPPEGGIEVLPPLLRPGLGTLGRHDGDYLLVYALNPGYGDVLAAWQAAHPGVRVHCYLDGGDEALGRRPAAGFTAHELDDEAFLEHLAGCRAFVGSAGFEAICEAFFLGKPVLAVPTEGQQEQAMNAWDAERHGAARAGGYADLSDFWERPCPPAPEKVEAFRRWVARAPELHVAAVERAAAQGRR